MGAFNLPLLAKVPTPLSLEEVSWGSVTALDTSTFIGSLQITAEKQKVSYYSIDILEGFYTMKDQHLDMVTKKKKGIYEEL